VGLDVVMPRYASGEMPASDDPYWLARREHAWRLRVLEGLSFRRVGLRLGITAAMARVLYCKWQRRFEHLAAMEEGKKWWVE
jgi:hypothetical protein